jgi:hypothetical protein
LETIAWKASHPSNYASSLSDESGNQHYYTHGPGPSASLFFPASSGGSGCIDQLTGSSASGSVNIR